MGDGARLGAKEYRDMGVKHFCIGSDVSILFEWFKRNGKAMCELMGRSASDGNPRDFRQSEGPGYGGG